MIRPLWIAYRNTWQNNGALSILPNCLRHRSGLSQVCLTWAFVTDDFSVLYVANHSQLSLPTVYNFSLTRPATVSLILKRIEALNADGSQELGPELRLIDERTYGEGDQTLEVTPDDVPPGDYVLILRARDGDQIDEREGSALSQFTSRLLNHGPDPFHDPNRL